MELTIVPISAIEHFVYCPRQCALIHCDGVWSDNAHTVRGLRAHRRVDGGQHRHERGRKVLRGIPLWSEALGLSGRADVVEIAIGAVRPVEYKSGRPARLCRRSPALRAGALSRRNARCRDPGRLCVVRGAATA